MRKTLLAVVVLLLPGAALAQQPQPSPAERNLAVALQQLAPAVTLFAEDMARQMAAKDARIAEVEKLCGDPCKPKAPEGK